MPTLRDVRSVVVPAAHELPVDPGDRPISWVRVLRARVPAFDALEAGDLAIVPATSLVLVAAGGQEIEALVGGLRAADVAGVLLVEPDPDHAAALDALR